MGIGKGGISMGIKMKIAIAAIAILVLCAVFYQTIFTSAESELSADEVSSLISQQYPGEIKTLELDRDNDEAVYHAMIESHGNLYDLLLDARNGEVLQLKVSEPQSSDRADNQPKENREEAGNPPEQTGNNAMLTEEEAVSIAQEEFAGKVTDVELDEEDGRRIYEIEIENGEDEATVEIDAYTGKVLKLEIDMD